MRGHKRKTLVHLNHYVTSGFISQKYFLSYRVLEITSLRVTKFLSSQVFNPFFNSSFRCIEYLSYPVFELSRLIVIETSSYRDL